MLRDAMGPSVRLRLFATARESVGRSALEVSLPPEGTTVADVLSRLQADHPQLRPIVKVSRVVLNGIYISDTSARVKSGDELAIHPPYSGG